ncbi:MAG: spondin domain-containing protein [Candidatus Poribacteria bacterium]|nr:spondin domain-containing protein [Candidatus Poribacteria bacterium]
MKDQLFNRKFLFSLLAVVMCLGFTAMSYGAAVVSIDPAEVESPAAGEQLMVNINVTGGAGVVGYQATVNFDATALEYVSAANADYLPAGAFPVIRPGDGSVLVGAGGATAAAAADGTLATVTFKVIEAKASTISLTGVVLSDAAAAELEVTTMDGMVTAPAADDAADDDTEADDAAADDAAADDTEADDAADDDTEADDAAADDAAADDTAEDVPADDAVADDAAEDAPAEEPAPEPVSQMFEITLTNLTTGEPGTGGQVLSPPIFVTHAAGINLAQVGQPASPALVLLAENGDTSGLAALAAAAGANAMPTTEVVPPGGSVTVTVTADMVNSSLSVGSMLVSTNDAFVAATDVALFDEDGAPVSASIDLNSYDAGSEENTEMASDIPGPLGLDAAADPEGSNERVPTEGGVIAPHEGIQGVGDVGEAFAWEEPTAMLTIAPVEAPAEPEVEAPPEPVVEAPPEPVISNFDVTLGPGLNMISIPLMPEEPYTAKSLAEMLGATVVIQFDAATQNFVGYTAADEGDGFGIDGGMGYIVNTPAGAMVKFSGQAWDNQPKPPEPPPEEPAPEDAPADDAAADDAAADDAAADAGDAAADDAADDAAADAGDAAPAAPALTTFKSAWAFIVTSDIHGMETGTTYTLVAENLRTGTIATENVTSDVRRSSAVWADLNRKSVVEAGDKLKIALYDERGTIVSGPFQRTVATADIRDAFLNLELRVGDVRPEDTILAQNFPNPFNPETWIPYQLSQATEVSIQIYNVSGHLVRSLDLGWQATGSYMTPSSAAYWDGRNAVGERVASGIYFYTLQTADFTATRRMVILK